MLIFALFEFSSKLQGVPGCHSKFENAFKFAVTVAVQNRLLTAVHVAGPSGPAYCHAVFLHWPTVQEA